MANEKTATEQFIEEMAAKDKDFDRKMDELRDNLITGKAGMKQEYGQWHLEIGQTTTYEQAFGINGNTLKIK